MNLKKGISVMLASTAMCTAISGAANACPGLEFAFGDELKAHELMNRASDGAQLYSPNFAPQINIPTMQVGEMRRFAFSVNNTQTNASFGCLGNLGALVNDTAADYGITVQIIGGMDDTNNQPIPPMNNVLFMNNNVPPVNNGANIPGLIDINVVQFGNVPVVEFHARGQCNVQGEIVIQSNTSALRLHIPFNCQVM